MKTFHQLWQRLDEGITAVLEHFAHRGGLAMFGLLLFILAAMASLAWLTFALRGGRHRLLAASAALLGIVGWVAYDFTYLSLNFAMRNSEAVRGDCQRLMQMQATTFIFARPMFLVGQNLPASFEELGLEAAIVDEGEVGLCRYYCGLSSGWWGYLYQPHGRPVAPNSLRKVRATWHQDFYEARTRGH